MMRTEIIRSEATRASGQARSVWAATARSSHTFPTLSGHRDCEVAIVGAGFCGLSAAHHLIAQQRQVVVLEAESPGWGASGRNGGMALPLWKSTYAELADSHGRQRAREMHALGLAAVDLVEDLAHRYQIECGFNRYGHITAAYREADLEALRQSHERLRNDLNDDTPSLLNRQEVSDLIGSDAYVGGYYEPRGGGLHPLNFCRGMARGIENAGAMIFEHSPVRAIEQRGNGITLSLDGGTVTAEHVLICTNAYGLLRLLGVDLRRWFVPVITSVIATDSVSSDLGVLPQGHLVSDTKWVLNYFRAAPNGGLLFGGRGLQRDDDPPASARALHRKMTDIFPQLKEHDIAHDWSGRVAVTRNGLPCIGQVGERIHYAFGFNGRGVALANLAGAGLVRAIVPEATALPMFPRFDPPAVPAPILQRPLTMAAMYWYGLRDRLRI